MIGTLLQDRYRLDAELGRGGTGAVYRAYDTLLERNVAVKILSASGLGSQGQARLLHEARLAAQLRHPNIIDIYDAGQSGDLAFIVMELLEGASLFDRRPAAIPEIVSVARQVCAALQHAHSHGVIHRDLKLENVILGPDGVATLTDFGLARSTASRLTSEGAIVGTVFYLSPEQILGQDVDGRADLYALGVMLYELTAGRLPFSGDDPLAVISQHLHAPVVPPGAYNSAIPPALDAIIVRLLSKQPDERPSSAGEVAQALADFADGTGSSDGAPLDRLVRGRLIGRANELAAAKALWKAIAGDGGASGPPERVLLIGGDAGVGKTPLLREVLVFAQLSGAYVFSGECYADGCLPYLPLAPVVHDAFLQLGRDHDLPDQVLADLAVIAPDLRLHGLSSVLPPDLGPHAQQQRLFESVTALFGRLAACSSPVRASTPSSPANVQAASGAASAAGASGAPVLIALEDVQWADSGTLTLLLHLARRSRSARFRMMFLLTYRDAELDDACCLNETLVELRREGLLAEIKLRGYTLAETAAVLATIFQQDPAPEFAEAVYLQTEGNLFYIEEVCKQLVEAGQIYRQDGTWRWPALNEVQLPHSVRATIQARVAKLPETAQDILRLASLIGREFDFDTLERAARAAPPGPGSAEWDEDALIDALEQAGRAQLIREVPQKGPETFAFAHGLVLAALRESTGGLRRRRLHRRVLAALEALHPDDFAALAYQAEQAGDSARACDYYRRAAERSLAAYANQEAERYLRSALAILAATGPGAADAQAGGSTGQVARAATLAALGEAVFRQARYEEAGEIWREAIALYRAAGDHNQVARLHARAARAVAYGNPARALQICRAGLDAVREMAPSGDSASSLPIEKSPEGGEPQGALAYPETPGMAALLHETARAYRFNHLGQKALPYCEQALALAQRLGLVEIQAEALATLAILPGRSLEVSRLALLQAIDLAESAGLLMAALRAHENLSDLLYKAGEWAGALRHRRAASGVARRAGVARWQYIHDLRLAALLVDLGDFSEADSILSALPHPSGGASLSPYWLLVPRVIEVRLLRVRGELAEAAARLGLYESEARERDEVEARAEFLSLLADVRLELGDLDSAAAAAGQAIVSVDRPERSTLPQLLARCVLAQVHALSGRADDAARLFDEAQEQPMPYETALGEALLVLTEARLAAAQGDHAGAAVPFADAVARFSSLGARWWLARALLDWAESDLAGRPAASDSARGRLADARTLFDEIGAPYYAARAAVVPAGWTTR